MTQVDHRLCQGTAFCVEIAPEVFSLSDDGVAVVDESNAGDAPAALLEEAVTLCPMRAIALD